MAEHKCHRDKGASPRQSPEHPPLQEVPAGAQALPAPAPGASAQPAPDPQPGPSGTKQGAKKPKERSRSRSRSASSARPPRSPSSGSKKGKKKKKVKDKKKEKDRSPSPSSESPEEDPAFDLQTTFAPAAAAATYASAVSSPVRPQDPPRSPARSLTPLPVQHIERFEKTNRQKADEVDRVRTIVCDSLEILSRELRKVSPSYIPFLLRLTPIVLSLISCQSRTKPVCYTIYYIILY